MGLKIQVLGVVQACGQLFALFPGMCTQEPESAAQWLAVPRGSSRRASQQKLLQSCPSSYIEAVRRIRTSRSSPVGPPPGTVARDSSGLAAPGQSVPCPNNWGNGMSSRGHWIVSDALMCAAVVDWVWLTHRTVQTGFTVGGAGEQKQTSSS